MPKREKSNWIELPARSYAMHRVEFWPAFWAADSPASRLGFFAAYSWEDCWDCWPNIFKEPFSAPPGVGRWLSASPPALPWPRLSQVIRGLPWELVSGRLAAAFGRSCKLGSELPMFPLPQVFRWKKKRPHRQLLNARTRR